MPNRSNALPVGYICIQKKELSYKHKNSRKVSLSAHIPNKKSLLSVTPFCNTKVVLFVELSKFYSIKSSFTSNFHVYSLGDLNKCVQSRHSLALENEREVADIDTSSAA